VAQRTLNGDEPGPLAPALPAGLLLGGRHQLGHALPALDGAPSIVWRAEDTVLARAVAVRILSDPPPDDPTSREQLREDFVSAAVLGGRATHPAIASVLDADIHPRDGARPALAYAVVRWVDAVPLLSLLTAGPLEPGRACRLVSHACAAVAALHQAGISHGRLHPGNLLVGVADQVTVTDAVVAAALHGDGNLPAGVEPEPGSAGSPGPQQVLADTVALAWVLHAALTGYWAGPRSWCRTLPVAPLDDAGRTRTPRSVRAGVPKPMDAVVRSVLQPGATTIRTPTQLGRALDPLGVGAEQTSDDPRTERRWRSRRWVPGGRWTRWGLRLAVAVAVALAGWVLGYQIGKVPDSGGSARTVAPPASGSPAKPTPAAALTLTKVTSFDPPPGDGEESETEVPNATDGDPTTAWHTDTYTASPLLGGIKPGVGLLVDTGSPVAVKRVDLILGDGGTDVELRAAPVTATTPPANPASYAVLARVSAAQGDGATLTPPAGTKARFWLVWITRLPAVSNGYQAAIAELAFRP
jgi:serine/threonine protein kinase